MASTYHTPVLLNESVDALEIKEDGIYIDATFGGAGHSLEILKRLGKNGRLISFDQDEDAVKNNPVPADDRRFTLVYNNFKFIANFAKYNSVPHVDGILADLGVSSHQFDCGERGFSFRFDAPLDMRMNRLAEKNAAGIVNGYSKEELVRIFRLYGELEGASRAAELICREREKRRISTTGDLSRCLSPIHNNRNEHKFLAKLYQALRIEVNGEMDSLEGFLNGALQILKPGGILSVITYHSLEDRMVKNFIKSGNIDGKIEKDIYGNAEGPFIAITRKPIIPSSGEIAANSRSRSAKLRVAKRRE